MRMILFVVAAAAAFAGCAGPQGGTVAIVNGEALRAADVIAAMPPRVDSQANMDSVRHRALEGLVIRQLFIQQARREGLDTTREFQYQFDLEKRALVNQKMYDDVVAPADKLSDLEVQSAYKLAGVEAHLRVIVVPSETAAQRIVAELDRGVPFETLAVKFSTHPTATNGGDYGRVPELQLDEPLRSKVQALKPGEHTGPVAVRNGYQVTQLVDTQPNEKLPPLGEYRQELEHRLKQQKRRELANQFLADLRARLVYDPSGLGVLVHKPLDSITDAEKELPVAVRDGDKYVKVQRLLKVAAQFPPGLDTMMREYAVKREVEEDLIFQAALDKKLDKTPDIATQLERKRGDLLYRALFKKVVSDSSAVTDSNVFAYWRQNRSRFPDRDSSQVIGMIRARLAAEMRDARFQVYAAGLRERAKIKVNEKLLGTLKREPPKPAK